MNEHLPPQPHGNLVYKLFVSHPKAAGESYWCHLWFALRTGLQMIFFALCLILHGIFPFLCEKTASNYICRLYTVIDARRQKLIDCAAERYRRHD